ncbi:MAG: RHS domain-containing protein [Deltaproteobacteria bacterium]|nr:RHS domain-containing protein [Deltaproteobacteria bacterium]
MSEWRDYDADWDWSHSYDAVVRLTGAVAGEPNDFSGSYGYGTDGLGNRRTMTVTGLGTVDLNYNAGTHQLVEAEVDSQVVNEWSYDAEGRVVQCGDHEFIYEAHRGLLRYFEDNDTEESWAYDYDYRNLRVRKVLPDMSEVHYHYDMEGRLIAETQAPYDPYKEYLWLGHRPIAMIASEEWIPNDSFTGEGGMTDFEVYSIHTDHLGTPIAMTDESGTVVWRHRFDPFGNKLELDEDADEDQEDVILNLRFPG